MIESLRPDDARRLIGRILDAGEYAFTKHAEEEMAKENPPLIQANCLNVLRGGVVEPPDLERGTWRYRVRTQVITVVVAFRSESRLSVVTAWRNAR